MKILQGEKIPAFLKAVENHRHKALYLVTLFTGLRRGEALGLTWDCIDFAGKTILVSKQMQRERIKGGQLRLVPLKNDKQRRISAGYRLSFGRLWTDMGLVFTNDTGGALDADAVYKAYKKLLADNELSDIRIHDLRHTAATLMIQNGDDIKTVQQALGHHTAAFTLDVYGHVTDKMKQDSADRMEAFIKSVQNIG